MLPLLISYVKGFLYYIWRGYEFRFLNFIRIFHRDEELTVMETGNWIRERIRIKDLKWVMKSVPKWKGWMLINWVWLRLGSYIYIYMVYTRVWWNDIVIDMFQYNGNNILPVGMFIVMSKLSCSCRRRPHRCSYCQEKGMNIFWITLL